MRLSATCQLPFAGAKYRRGNPENRPARLRFGGFARDHRPLDMSYCSTSSVSKDSLSTPGIRRTSSVNVGAWAKILLAGSIERANGGRFVDIAKDSTISPSRGAWTDTREG